MSRLSIKRAKNKLNINKIKNFDTAVTELKKYSENIDSQFGKIISGNLSQNTDDGMEFLFKLFKRGDLRHKNIKKMFILFN